MVEPGYYRDLAHDSHDPAVLHRLAHSPYPFVQHAVAVNPHTPPAALVELAARCHEVAARPDSWNDNCLLLLLARRPEAAPAVLSAVLAAVAARLAAGARPYAAALALAGRPGLPPHELLSLGALPGASARLRGGLRRALETRALQTRAAGTRAAAAPGQVG